MPNPYIYWFPLEIPKSQKNMLNQNRKIKKDEISSIPLEDRVALEADITDARATSIDLENYRNMTPEAYWGSIDWRRYSKSFLGNVAGKRVLDVACGYSMTPVWFAMEGAEVVALDVAPITLEKVSEVAAMHGVKDRVSTYCGPAEQLPYKDNEFDIIFGGAALHHLVLDLAGQELSRVLKPGGRGSFQDPLSTNKIIEFIRDYINYSEKHPEKGTDKPLSLEDIELFSSFFKSSDWRGFGVTTSSIRAIRPLRAIRKQLETTDEILFKLIPMLNKYAQYGIINVVN
jgi:ubiquinone/menaquinone biosynthesis C-methylase UbiE